MIKPPLSWKLLLTSSTGKLIYFWNLFGEMARWANLASLNSYNPMLSQVAIEIVEKNFEATLTPDDLATHDSKGIRFDDTYIRNPRLGVSIRTARGSPAGSGTSGPFIQAVLGGGHGGEVTKHFALTCHHVVSSTP